MYHYYQDVKRYLLIQDCCWLISNARSVNATRRRRCAKTMSALPSESMKTGTGQHDIDAEVLTTESAVEEPFNNMIGQVLEKQKAEGHVGGRRLPYAAEC